MSAENDKNQLPDPPDSSASDPQGQAEPGSLETGPPAYSGDPYGSHDDAYPYGTEPYTSSAEPYGALASETAVPAVIADTPLPPPPSTPETSDDDDDDEGMLRMSFLEHLEELRTRIIHGVVGLAIAFIVSLTFSERLWAIVQQPATAALLELGYKDAGLIYTSPMEGFSIIWMKLPLLTAVFVASPWILYQAWSFIAPGLYKKERRFAAPFIICSAGLFITGGLFAYFVAFRFGLTFLLGIGKDVGVRPMVTISEYFDIFVNVILGISVVFELPVLIFFLTLLRIASPRFLIRNSRYAVLAIVVMAAVITPTPDVFNLMIFSVPMVLLYFVGIFASYLLELSRENKRFPWGLVLLILFGIAAAIAAAVWLAVARYGYRMIGEWPYLTR